MFYYLLICDFEEETVEHTLFFCDHARAVWFGSNIGYLSHFDKSVSIVEWLKKLMDLKNMVYIKRETILSRLFSQGGQSAESPNLLEWNELV